MSFSRKQMAVLVVGEIIASLILVAVVVWVFKANQTSVAGPSGVAPSVGEPGAPGEPGVMMIALPPFELVERSGKPFGSANLKGKVWIANFIFTRCTGPCPALTSQMYLLQHQLKKHPQWENIRLISFTVDPDYDTPPILTERARISEADEKQWLWLTGTREQMWQLVRDGFLLPIDENKQDAKSPIVHSQKFVLVDQSGMIRGFYDGFDADAREQMLSELDRLLK